MVKQQGLVRAARETTAYAIDGTVIVVGDSQGKQFMVRNAMRVGWDGMGWMMSRNTSNTTRRQNKQDIE